MLKRYPSCTYLYIEVGQPPSGGCVLKLPQSVVAMITVIPAAFGRLCVETTLKKVS